MASVSLRGVSKTYREAASGKEIAAVKAIDLEIRDGEFVVLVGPSGCGKTTTLRIVAGLEDVAAGEIRIGERLMNRVPPKDRNIALVFQNYALYPHMTVYRNMAFGLELRYRSDWLSRFWLALTQPELASHLAEKRRGIRRRVEQAAEMLGIKQLLHRKPGELSGGEKQRVALGRAVVREPAVFLFDEPLSNLDANLRSEMRRELRQLHAGLSATMLYVTHDQVEAMTLGDRIVVMHQGEIRQVGTPLEVYDCPSDRFVARFLGSPPMNLVEGRLESLTGGGWAFAGEIRVSALEELLVPDSLRSQREVSLGIRPEDVRISIDAAADSQAVVEAVEPLGDATLVHVRCRADRNSAIITAKLRQRDVPLVGSGVAVGFDRNRLHWFDTKTDKRLKKVASGDT